MQGLQWGRCRVVHSPTALFLTTEPARNRYVLVGVNESIGGSLSKQSWLLVIVVRTVTLISGEKPTDMYMLRIVPFVHLAHASCSMILRMKLYR